MADLNLEKLGQLLNALRAPPQPRSLEDLGNSFNLPTVDIQSLGTAPQVSANYNLPLGQGDVSARAKYWKPIPQMPPDWSASLGYHRSF